jgi:tetratricopeptide (TPR) repeat protein
LLADALLRVQRVNSDGRAVIIAEEHLRRLLQQRPAQYEARRMLGAVLLSEHRFGEAIAEAERARAADSRDPWNYGVIGDGALELGDYPRAFDAFDRMGQLAPGPAAYARTSYGLEVKGELAAAVDYMRMAADGTSPNDPESQAWHYSQIGDLLLQLGRVRDGRLEYERAVATFPDHPLAIQGLARVRIIEGDLKGARLMLQQQLATAPTPELAALVGDLCVALEEPDAAEPYFRMVEQIERAAWANGPRQPHVLARFYIDHDRNLVEALALAEEAARARRDIFTMDVLASAYLKAGRLDEAAKSADAALRTGTRDARILWHAAEIRAAQRDPAGARELLQRIPSTNGLADLHVRAGILALHARLTRT